MLGVGVEVSNVLIRLDRVVLDVIGAERTDDRFSSYLMLL
jgi:hypothetical protein